MRKTNPKFKIFESIPKDRIASSLYIACAGNVTKVGFSQSILDRSKALLADLERRSGSRFHGIVFFPGAGGYEEEKGLIELMKKNFPVFHGNEYFSCHFDDAYEMVRDYCRTSRVAFLAAEEKRIAYEISSLHRDIRWREQSIAEHRQHVAEDRMFSAFDESP